MIQPEFSDSDPFASQTRNPQVVAKAVSDTVAVDAELIDHSRRPRLWIFAYLACFCAFIGVIASVIVTLAFDLGEVTLSLTALLVFFGVVMSIVELVRPRWVNGRPRRVLPILGLLGNLMVGCGLLFAILLYAARDGIREGMREQQIAQRKAADRRRDQAFRANPNRRGREQEWDYGRQTLRKQKEAEERAIRRAKEIEEARILEIELRKKREAEERIEAAKRKVELARQEVARRIAREKQLMREEEQQKKEDEALEKRLTTFALGASDSSTKRLVVRYVDNPSQASSKLLKLLHHKDVKNGSLYFFDETFDESVYSPISKRLYALQNSELLAVDLSKHMIVRRLKLHLNSEDLVVTKNGPMLMYGGRFLLLDWDLQPIGSAPAEDVKRIFGVPSSSLLVAVRQSKKYNSTPEKISYDTNIIVNAPPGSMSYPGSVTVHGYVYKAASLAGFEGIPSGIPSVVRKRYMYRKSDGTRLDLYSTSRSIIAGYVPKDKKIFEAMQGLGRIVVSPGATEVNGELSSFWT